MEIDTRKALILLSIVVAVAVVGAIVLNEYSAAKAQITVNGECCFGYGAKWFARNMSTEMRKLPHGGMCGRGCFGCGFIEVSDEFKESVVNIAEGDVDVQNLLNEGYNITAVKPIIKAVVKGDGTVIIKATNAILMLEKDTTGRAIVKVDMENAKVTEIVILTKTVIQK